MMEPNRPQEGSLLSTDQRRLSPLRRVALASVWMLALIALCIVPALAEAQRCYCITGPDPMSACPGTTVAFEVDATGEGPLIYQWFHGSIALSEGGNISGSDSAELRIRDIGDRDAGEYSVLVSGPRGSIRSDVALLYVKAVTVVTDAPDAVEVCPGGSAVFQVAGAGEGVLTYQWYHGSAPLSDGERVSGSTGTHLQINDVNAQDAGDYVVKIAGECGTATSSASLVVKVPTVITEAPDDVSACPGDAVAFVVAASGEGALMYQWYHDSAALEDGDRFSGTTDKRLTIVDVEAPDAGSYTVRVTGACGAVTSSAAALLVKKPTEISDQPEDLSLCPGSAAVFSVAASGDGTLVYQWFHDSVPLEDDERVTGTCSNRLEILSVGASDAGNYAVSVQGGCGTTNSVVAALTVKAATSIIELPVSVAVVAGASVNFSVDAVGEGSLLYQWFHDSTPLSDDEHIAGATTSQLKIDTVEETDAGLYSVTVTGGCGDVSGSATLSVRPAIGTLEIVREQADLLVVLDLSSSMEEEVEGGVKIALAKDALQQLFTTLPDDSRVGLRTFHKCGRSDLEVPIQPIRDGELLDTLEKLDTYGTTPLAYTLQQIPGDLAGVEGTHVILFITDGMETCNGDPVAEAGALASSGLDYVLKLVGFDVSSYGDRVAKQLRAIAEAADGSFTEAESGSDLLDAVFDLVFPPTYQVKDSAGVVVKEGTTGDGPFELHVGVYTVVVGTDPQTIIDEVTIEVDGATTVAVPHE